MSPEERFWSMVRRDGPDSCWEWQGYHMRDGYGAFHYQGKRIIASRFAWILAYGEIPNGMCVLHRCDNPSCVNPRHLFLGTQKDNMQDAVLKLRKSGPHNGRTKLSWPQVDTIRLLFQMGWSTRRVAKLFGVDHKTIWQIRAGKTWKEPAEVMGARAPEEGSFEVIGSGDVAGSQALILRVPKKNEEEEVFEVALFRAGKEKRGEVALSFQKEEFFMKAKGMWFVTERVETPALTLEFPVGFFRSREAALAFVKGKEKSYRMRFIQSDLGEDSEGLGEAEENLKSVPEGAPCSGDPKGVPERAPSSSSGAQQGAPEKTQGVFSGYRREEF